MFGINGPEFLLLLLIGILVIGPQQAARIHPETRQPGPEVRRMASGAREQIKEEVGIDIDDVDWKKYDPRQYDPRRIIKEALLDDDTKPVSAGGPVAVAAAASAAASRRGAAGPHHRKPGRGRAGALRLRSHLAHLAGFPTGSVRRVSYRFNHRRA